MSERVPDKTMRMWKIGDTLRWLWGGFAKWKKGSQGSRPVNSSYRDALDVAIRLARGSRTVGELFALKL
jgi:hypothetical protein